MQYCDLATAPKNSNSVYLPTSYTSYYGVTIGCRNKSTTGTTSIVFIDSLSLSYFKCHGAVGSSNLGEVNFSYVTLGY